jgi:uncharacterized membrane-anchored protein YjiN (DUF445 family)
MEERQVYISFEGLEYKSNKASLLQCKSEIIQLQKRLVTLHALRSHKKRLLSNLAHLISSTEFVTERLEEKMPDHEMPRHLKSQLSKKVEKVKQKLIAPKHPKEEIMKEAFDVSDLDKELMELNRRIRELG